MRHRRPIARPAVIAATLALLAGWAAGCGSSYDGSATFYQSHPEYQDRPAYFDHSVSQFHHDDD